MGKWRSWCFVLIAEGLGKMKCRPAPLFLRPNLDVAA